MRTPESFLSTSEVINAEGISRVTLWYRCRANGIKAYRIAGKGNQNFYRKADIEQMLKPAPVNKTTIISEEDSEEQE
jgi:hypothetical protein